MKINGVTLNAFQTNFIKELMGDPFMTDVRAEAYLNKVTAKYQVDLGPILTAVNNTFEAKNAAFKALEAEDASRG